MVWYSHLFKSFPQFVMIHFGDLREEQIHWKDPDGGKDRRQEEKGLIEEEMVGFA